MSTQFEMLMKAEPTNGSREEARTAPPLSPSNTSGRFYARIPVYEKLGPTERAAVDNGGPYPVELSEHLPEHETFLDFLIDRSLEAWTRSRG